MIKTSHVGSLPFVREVDANNFNLNFDLPVLYTLPIFDESEFMIPQVLGGTKHSEFNIDILDQKILIKRVESIQDFDLFKFQLVGPITLIKSFKEITSSDIELLLSWYESKITELFDLNIMKKCYFFLDEPMLFKATDKEYKLLNSFLEKLSHKFFKLGVHCCSQFDIQKMNLSLLDGLSFESKYYEAGSYQDLDLFLGVLDTVTLNSDPAIDLSSITNEIYVTPHCGLALSGSKDMELVSKNLTEWAKVASQKQNDTV